MKNLFVGFAMLAASTAIPQIPNGRPSFRSGSPMSPNGWPGTGPTDVRTSTPVGINADAQTPIRAETFGIPLSSICEDAQAIGMGKTQVGNGMQFNAMMYNPALLANERSDFELPSLQASLPTKSFSAISFLSDNLSQFTKGTFVQDIKGGVTEYRNAQTDDARLAALRRIQNGLRFISDVQDNVGGTTENPKIHGISVVPGIQGQFGNFGISVYGIAQTAFTVYSSQAVSELARVRVPQSAQVITTETLAQLGAAADALLNQDGTLKDGAVPTALAISYVDLVAAGGYGVYLNNALSIGANVKVVNRRFSSKLIEPNSYDKILKELRSDFNNSVTGVTADLGAMYRFAKSGTQAGLSVQNIIPVRNVSSEMNLKNYGVDENGNTFEQRVVLPFELRLPLLVNVGAVHPITDNWDVAFDVADLASQDDKYEDYIERVRVGMEYRLQTSGNGFRVAFRGGLADRRPTLGLGLNFFRVVQIDGAYAFDNYVGDNSYFAQVRFRF